MSSINYRRLMVSGLLAAVVMIAGQIAVIGTLGPRLMAARDAAHLPPMVPQPLLNVLEVLSLGFAIAWLYAAIRPRYGTGVLTAARAGLCAWFFLGFLGTIHAINDNLGFPTRLLVLVAAGMLPVVVLASIAGAWAYRE